MIAEWRAAGRPVAVVGLARSGVAATLLLRDRGVPVYASDSAAPERLEGAARELRAAGADVELGRHDLARIAAAEAVVVSPGVPPDVPPLRAARERGVPVYAEVDLGSLGRHVPCGDDLCLGLGAPAHSALGQQSPRRPDCL